MKVCYYATNFILIIFIQHFQGQVTTIAGCGYPGFADGQHQNAMFTFPRSVCFSQFHNCLFVSDDNHRIRKIDLKTGRYCFNFNSTLKYFSFTTQEM